MPKTKSKLKKINCLKIFIILVLLTLGSSCRELSVFFDPAKNAPKKQLKVVKRDKPNLADDTEAREVDPDSDDLIEATDEEADSTEETVASDTNTNTSKETNTNTAEPNAELAKIEQKAKALVGKWEKAIDEENKIVFDFGGSKKEGETFVGTLTIYTNGEPNPPAKYIVSADELIKLIANGNEKNIKVDVSADRKTMRLTIDGKVETLTKANSQPQKQPEQQPEEPKTQVTPQQPKATPRRPEIPDQD